MLNIASKPADQIGIRDIEELIEAEVPEGQQLEFKRAISNKKDEHALLEGAVAFANAQGGTLLLGIRESSGKPSIATEITPVPDCVELADRLSKLLRDCVEPKIPAIEVFGVFVEGDSGVVIIRVGRSRLAPHWVKKTRACKVRRADRSEQMTMWEVQDMTLNAPRGMKGFKERLRGRSERFQELFDDLLQTPEESLGIRITALPVGEDVRFDRVHQKNDLLASWCPVFEAKKDGKKQRLNVPEGFPLPPCSWRPILRGTRNGGAVQPYNLGYLSHPILDGTQNINTPSGRAGMFRYQELHCDGMLELGYASCRQGSIANEDFDPDWPLVLLANTVVWATHVRSQSPAPMAEYGLQIEILYRGEKAVYIRRNGPPRSDYWLSLGIPIPSVIFPNYSLDHEETPAALLQTFYRDFCNRLGIDGDREFEIGEKQDN